MEIEGYSNYLIYEDGRVYSKYKNIFLKHACNRHGYLVCGLFNDGKEKKVKIHRLVAIHYIPNPENKPCVDHKNRDRQDNRIENLRWATRCENNQNKGVYKNNTSGTKNIYTHLNGYRYIKIMNKKTHTKYFRTLEEAIQYKEEYEGKKQK